MTPKVSVIMPCYNEPIDIFRRSLSSVVAQTLCQVAGAVEVIIVLDKPDNIELAEIIWEYQREFDNIVFLTPEKNLGRGNARNLALSVAQGDYIAIHDADDVDVPERLEQQLNYAHQTGANVLFSNIRFVNAEWNQTEYQPRARVNTSHPSYFRKFINHTTMFSKRETLLKYGGYPDRKYLEDTELWIRMFLWGEKFHSMERIHSDYLIPQESEHSEYVAKMKRWNWEAIKISLKYGKHFLDDKYFYRYFAFTLLNQFFLQFGRKGHNLWMKTMRATMQNLRNIKKWFLRNQSHTEKS